MKSYPGKDVVSYLVDHKYAASKKDAVDLGRVLASHLSLFECVSKKGKLLVRSKLTGRAERGVGSGCFGQGCKPARFLKRFWRPSAGHARWIAANRVLPDSPSRILSGTYSESV